MTITKDNADKIIVLARYEEKQQALIDTMLCTWSEVETYNDLYRNIDRLTGAQQVEVAQAIIDRRKDASND